MRSTGIQIPTSRSPTGIPGAGMAYSSGIPGPRGILPSSCNIGPGAASPKSGTCSVAFQRKSAQSPDLAVETQMQRSPGELIPRPVGQR